MKDQLALVLPQLAKQWFGKAMPKVQAESMAENTVNRLECMQYNSDDEKAYQAVKHAKKLMEFVYGPKP